MISLNLFFRRCSWKKRSKISEVGFLKISPSRRISALEVEVQQIFGILEISGPIRGLDQAWERQQLAVEQEEVRVVCVFLFFWVEGSWKTAGARW